MVNNIDKKMSALLARFSGVKNTSSGKWLAKCSAHPDRLPSLAIKQAEDRILIH